ncbi:MAG: hypothetical protein JXA73_24525 [Acidobacteria bacterium]|nr:hypothetical protein [Acidobacteriota bacterium]
MSKRRILLSAFIVALIVIGFLSAPQAKVADLPPGVTAETWIPLSDNSGVLLSSDARLLSGRNRVARGTLFVKVDNVWHRFYPDPGPAVFMPVK